MQGSNFMSILSKINPFKKLKNKLNNLKLETEIQLSGLKRKLTIQNKELLRLKKKMKSINNKKINVVFVCHNCQIWGVLKTACKECIEDKKFNVKIIIIPGTIIDLDQEHIKKETKKIQDFFIDYKCEIIQGYNYDSEEWLDLRSLEPDYLFFQVPYNSLRPPQYHSNVVSSYTSLCYVPYAYPLLGNTIEEEVYPRSFFQDLYCVFAHSQKGKEWLLKYFNDVEFFDKNSVEVVGSPRFDHLDRYKNTESNLWKYKGNNRKFRIIWTPYFSIREGLSNFFEYTDLFFKYARSNEDVEIMLRPHPLMWSEFVSTKEMSLEEVEQFKERWTSMHNMSIDESYDYYDKFFSSDVIVSDISSIFGPYFLTGNPLVYCRKNDSFNEEGKNLAKGFYVTCSWKEVESTLNMLKNGEDPLMEKRKKIIENNFYLPERGAGFKIKEFLKQDLNKK